MQLDTNSNINQIVYNKYHQVFIFALALSYMSLTFVL